MVPKTRRNLETPRNRESPGFLCLSFCIITPAFCYLFFIVVSGTYSPAFSLGGSILHFPLFILYLEEYPNGFTTFLQDVHLVSQNHPSFGGKSSVPCRTALDLTEVGHDNRAAFYLSLYGKQKRRGWSLVKEARPQRFLRLDAQEQAVA